MKLLVLGGTRFVGRLIAETAIERGHLVTTFNRGRTGSDVVGVESVHGDREETADLATLVNAREWDAVIDTSGYVPAVVGSAAHVLSSRAPTYVFMSTVSVYPDWPNEGVSENSLVYDCAPDVTGTAKNSATWPAAHYGSYKAGCERAVTAAFNGRVLILRPGVILGPHENVGRLTWWLSRIAAGGHVLAPGDEQRTIQPIDVRDLAEFTVLCIETGVAGTFNVTAPVGHATFGGLLDSCVDETGSDSELEWVDDAFLLANGISQWTEIPLWRTYPGTWRVDSGGALASGLRCRPVSATVADTWQWLSAGHRPVPSARQSHHGLDRDKEAHLLMLWKLHLQAVSGS
jgi:nucleoside-diphosphate-sugar epimerase